MRSAGPQRNGTNAVTPATDTAARTLVEVAEESVVGSCFGPFAEQVIPALAATLRPDDFQSPALGHIYAAALAIHGSGTTPDYVLVATELQRRSLLDSVGGQPRLIELQADGVVGRSRAVAHAELIAQERRRRTTHMLLLEATKAMTDRDELGLARAIDELTASRSEDDGTERRLIGAGTFAYGAPASVPAVWGRDDHVLIAEGEPTLLVGPVGVGKTTIAQQVSLARAGLGESVLGYPVVRGERRVLYVAADRPRQVQRSLARMVSEDQVEELDERMTVWQGPPPEDLASRPGALTDLCRRAGADTVILDSLKDMAVDLVKDDVGQRLHIAFQTAVAAGIEVVALHHQRKEQRGGQGKPKTISDVYGSVWIPAGAGSVLLLWGEPGDGVVELSHLKQPAGVVGPLSITHDHLAGRSHVAEVVDAWDYLKDARRGMTAEGLAQCLWQSSEKQAVERARRQLEGLVRKGLAHKDGGGPAAGQKGVQASVYYPVDRREEDF